LAPRALGKKATQAPGLVLIIVGMFPFILGLVLGSWTTCPLPGCPPSVISRLGWQNAGLFFSGIALIATGRTSLLLARQRTNAHDKPRLPKCSNSKKITKRGIEVLPAPQLSLRRSLCRQVAILTFVGLETGFNTRAGPFTLSSFNAYKLKE
jgi:hypothetical protein